ncbi:MAG: protein of unknown function DUF1653 [uncultured bacterium]|nr:MAG: protein of unknown function DUF1653 [uncultured bacterium]
MIELGTYRHYKGHEYDVIGVARHSETLEELVVYCLLSDPTEIWVRPLKMFFETVEVDGVTKQRFTRMASR